MTTRRHLIHCLITALGGISMARPAHFSPLCVLLLGAAIFHLIDAIRTHIDARHVKRGLELIRQFQISNLKSEIPRASASLRLCVNPEAHLK